MEDQELRFVCKLCNKKYPCGKSLGGHMRSHVVANSVESEEKTFLDPANTTKKFSSSSFAAAASMNNDSFGTGQHSNYGLRENPRKTWRAVDATFPSPQERVCKQCGKGFQSLKALCGHMACHTDRDKAGLKDDHSWTSENQKLVLDSHSDTEEADERILRTRSSSKPKRYKKIVVKSSYFTLTNNGSSSVSEIDGEEQEEVAMCLMLLSRDSGNKGGVTSVVESSDNNSVILETKSSSIDMKMGKMEPTKTINYREEIPKKTADGKKLSVAQMENSDSGYFLDECGKAESEVSVDGFGRYGSFAEYNKPVMRGEYYSDEFRQGLNRNGSYIGEREYNGGMASNSPRIESRRRSSYVSENPDTCNEYGSTHKRSKYECFNCKKTFKSYQALGGHRPCYKMSNTYYDSKYDSGENSLDDDPAEFVVTGKAVESARNQKSSGKNSPSKYASDKKNKAKKNNGHVCPFCNRVFKNGQALGGHKRSHFIGGHEIHSNNLRNVPAKPDLLDLNLPAPEEDGNDGNGQFSRW